MFRLTSVCLLAAFSAAENVRPTESKTIFGDASFNMRWVPEDEMVEFIVTMAQSDSWVGLVFGQTAGRMNAGDDMIIFKAKGLDSTFEDYASKGYSVPELDSSQDVKSHPNGSVELDDSKN